LAGIRNPTQVEAVWLQGRYFDRAAITALLDQSKTGGKRLRSLKP
jgi:hypothetical protein